MSKKKVKKKNPKITLRQNQVNNLKDEISHIATVNSLTLFLTVLHDKEGF